MLGRASLVEDRPFVGSRAETYRQFETAKAIMAANSAAMKLTREQWLYLYGWESQGTIGDIQSSRPWYWNRNAAARWDAWKDDFGMSCDQARSKYVQEVLKIIAAKATKKIQRSGLHR
ncbi:BQ5605_C022g09444 [Microbotryum silenes-dioicae]|uniref:BQ5605_C022g09444 protein n=1 Tax=Microbotryum silenes-dioicae TaxID=796604 RepID=A0A2X0MKN0_9BASI|nr:BQ5605_C022g09444 [Microbotryum silenes-dioicae]